MYVIMEDIGSSSKIKNGNEDKCLDSLYAEMKVLADCKEKLKLIHDNFDRFYQIHENIAQFKQNIVAFQICTNKFVKNFLLLFVKNVFCQKETHFEFVFYKN